MILRQQRVRSTRALAGLIKKDTKFTVGVKNLNRFGDVLRNIGFSENPNSGDSILPRDVGPVSLYNAEGKYVPQKDQPMETAYRMAEWHWTEFHGPYEVEQSKIVDVPYQRYPRKFFPPPSVELAITSLGDGSLCAIGPILEFNDENEKMIVHVINLFLEIFGECQFFTSDLDELIKIPIKRLNWHILPPGKRPWEKLKEEIKPIINDAPKGNQPVIEHRLETINKHNPDFAAVGQGGFRGYIVLGFTEKNIYVLESLYYGNATYIFDDNWEDLSKKTKAEVLNENLQKDRFIHLTSWDRQINNLLGK